MRTTPKSRPFRPAASRKNAGYSAVEIIVASAIGVLIAVIGFSGTRIFDTELPVKSQARRFAHCVSTARSFAIARNAFYRVSFDLDNRSFWIDRINDPNAPPPIPANDRYEPKVVSPEGVDERVLVNGIFYGVTRTAATSGIQSVIFRPDGSADVEARVEFHQISQDPTVDSNIFTVRIYGPSGLNKVFPHQRI